MLKLTFQLEIGKKTSLKFTWKTSSTIPNTPKNIRRFQFQICNQISQKHSPYHSEYDNVYKIFNLHLPLLLKKPFKGKFQISFSSQYN